MHVKTQWGSQVQLSRISTAKYVDYRTDTTGLLQLQVVKVESNERVKHYTDDSNQLAHKRNQLVINSHILNDYSHINN